MEVGHNLHDDVLEFVRAPWVAWQNFGGVAHRRKIY
jgi:hypothetical protein